MLLRYGLFSILLSSITIMASAGELTLKRGDAATALTSHPLPRTAAVLEMPADLPTQLRGLGNDVGLDVPTVDGTMRLRCAPFTIMTSEAMVVRGTHLGDVAEPVPDHVLLRGTVDGLHGSHVYIAAFETHMVGIIEIPGPGGKDRWMLLPDTLIPGRTSKLVMAPMPVLGGTPVPCLAEDVAGNARRADSIFALVANDQNATEKPFDATQANTLYGLQVAVDCSIGFYNKHGADFTLAAQYAITVVGASSAVYQRDAAIQLQVPYLRVWTETDPYPGDIGAALSGILNYWNANMGYVKRSVTMLLSADVGGGLAYVGVLCGGYGYNVSSVGGNVNFPANGYIWDIDVTSHELGHNIGSSHTHNCGWNPPLDSCWNAEGGCYDATRPQRGTIMSYCHLQNKGTELQFHPRVASLFRSVMDRTNCVGPVRDVLATDAAVVSVNTPMNGAVIGLKTGFRPTALVRNTGRQPLTNVLVTCRITTLRGGERKNLTQTLPALDAGSTRTVIFDAISIDSAGDYLAEYAVTAGGDLYATNDVLTRPFRVGTAVSGSVRMLSPNGGETLRSGTVVDVTWTAVSVTRARLEVSTDDGATWGTVRFNVDATTGLEKWTVPYTPTATARMRIVSLQNAQGADVSDNTFRIVADTDVAVVDILDPVVNGTVNSPFTPRIVVFNQGATDVRNARLRLAMRWVRQVDQTYDVTVDVPLIRAGATDTIAMPPTPLMANGTHVVEAIVAAPNDNNAANDRIGRSFTSVGLSPPSDVRAEEGDAHVVLRWQIRDPNDSDQVEIHVRRGTEPEFRLLRVVSRTVDTYVVESPNGDSVHVRLHLRRGAVRSTASQTLGALPQRFSSGSRLTAPTALGPAHGATRVPVPLDLVWTDVEGADQYEVQVATDRAFDDLVHVAVTRNDGTLPLPRSASRPLWWRVRAINPTNIGPWSQEESFTATGSCAGNGFELTGSVNAVQPDITWDGGPVTVEFWQYVRQADVRNSTSFMIGASDNTKNRFQTHAPWSDGRIYWDYGNVDDKGRLSTSYGAALNKWTHVALVSNGVDFKAIYFDGVLAASDKTASAPTGLKGVTVGAMLNGLYAAGMMDEIRLWKTARTQEQIRATMHRRQPLPTEMRDLVALWRFDDQNLGTVARDISGNNRPLTLSAASWKPSGAIVNCDDAVALPGISIDPVVPDTAPRSPSFVIELPRIPNAQWMDVVIFPEGSSATEYSFKANNVVDGAVRIGTLRPATTYVVRARGRSAVGVGPWVEAVMQTPPACDSTVVRFDGLPTVFVADTFKFDGRAVTVEYWSNVKRTDVRNSSIFSLGQFENGAYRAQAHSPWSDPLDVFFDWGAWSDVGRLRAPYTQQLDKWTHVALVSNGYDLMQIYYDGRLATRSSFAGRIDTASRLVLGGNFYGGTLHRGDVADMRIWNVPLTEERIRERMHERIAEPRSNLLAAFPLDEGTGGATIDGVRGVVATAPSDTMWTQRTRSVYHVWPSIHASNTAHRMDTASYSVRSRPGMTFAWSVKGGSIAGGQGTSSIVVRWDSSAQRGTIGIVRTFDGGCVDSARLDVDVQPFVSVHDDIAHAVVVRPNPASRRVVVESDSPILGIRIVAVTGAVVQDLAYPERQTSIDIDVQSCAIGTYTLVVRTALGVMHHPLVIHR